MKKGVLLTIVLLFCASLAFAQGMVRPTVRPNEYGNVVINNFSEKHNIAPVVFNHWLHRAEYTCRLCHIDLGFGMQVNSTKMTEDDNLNGLYCGACHDGKEAFGPKSRDEAGNEQKNCDRCHSYKMKVKFEKDFYKFFKGFPRARFGNKVDWIQAEEQGLVKLKDFLEGYTIPGGTLKQTKDIAFKSKEMGLPDIIFSHKKHTIWNGCEVCHPMIFNVKKGSTVYSMQDIFDGRFCGACHGKVAFPNTDCQLCHTKEVY